MIAVAIEEMVRAVPMALICADADQRVIAANHPAATMFGKPLVGLPCSAILRHPDFLNGLDACIGEARAVVARVAIPGAAGETHLSISLTPVPTAGGTVAVIGFEDLSAAEQAGAIRRDFVANVSHELRTPLTALVGFIETLRGAARDDPAARERFLTIMEREAGRMIRLVNDLLSLSRVEAEERQRPSGQAEILSILRTTLASHEEQARSAGVALDLEADVATFPIRADADQLAQVFHNLIENAIKYGGAGGTVTVRVAGIDHEPVLRGPAVRIDVIDRGEGIDPLHLPRLSERFYRVDSDRSRGKGGTGLGLAIVKHIVNRHRGRLRIDSEVGKGSCFSVVLPVH